MLGIDRSSTATIQRPTVGGGGDRVRLGWRGVRRRRVLPYVSLGAVLVIGSVVAFAVTAVGLGERTAVLAVARPVAAGQVIEAADLRQVSVAADEELGLVPAAEAGQVVGRTAAVPLAVGVLVTRSLLGAAAFPPAGKVVASVALKPGQYPQGLPGGASVAVYLSDPATTTGAAPVDATSTGGPLTGAEASGGLVPLSATVLGVEPAGDGQGGVVVTLLLPAEAGARLAAAPATGLVLMQTAPGGD